jgi:hypothetical protein
MQEAGKPLRAVMRALLFRRDCSVDRRSPSTNGAEKLEQLEGAIGEMDYDLPRESSVGLD